MSELLQGTSKNLAIQKLGPLKYMCCKGQILFLEFFVPLSAHGGDFFHDMYCRVAVTQNSLFKGLRKKDRKMSFHVHKKLK